jgi:hypothetical protein
MDETSLRAMFERAVAERPPTPRLVPDSVRAGARLRKRRRIEAAVGSIAAIAVISAIASAAAGAFSPAGKPPSVSGGRTSSHTAFIWTGANTVTPVRLGSGKVLTALKIPGVIQDIAATPDGKTVYVFSNTEPNTNAGLFSYLMAINSATGRASSPVKLTGNSLVSNISGVQIAPNGKVAYATEFGTWPANGKYGGTALVAINLATGAQQMLTEAGDGLWQITPGAQTAYAAGRNGQVDEFDLATGTLLPPIKLRAPGTVFGIALGPGGSTIYAASVPRLSASAPSRATTWVTPISTATNIAAKPIEVRNPGFLPDIAIAPDGQTGYLSGGQYLCPFSLATGKALKPIKLPHAFAVYVSVFGISPDSKFGDEYQPRSTTVQLINLASGRVLRPAALPGGYRQSAPGIFNGGSTVYVPASIYRGALPSLGALFPLQPATGHLGRPILFSGVPNGAVFVP